MLISSAAVLMSYACRQWNCLIHKKKCLLNENSGASDENVDLQAAGIHLYRYLCSSPEYPFDIYGSIYISRDCNTCPSFTELNVFSLSILGQ